MFLLDTLLGVIAVVAYYILVVTIAFLSNYMATYLQYIQLSLESIHLENVTEVDNYKVQKHLQRICNDHQNAIRLINVMNETFYIIYFVKFLIYSVFYCILLYILILVNDKQSILTRLILVVSFQLESLILCYYGDKLTTEVSPLLLSFRLIF